MTYLDQVQRGIDYIEANLDFDIALKDVAEAASISQWHFQRIFKALTSETLKTYIRSRRMANALEKLLNNKIRIIDIALSAGFETQESFTRAFKKQFLMTPNEYRKLGEKNRFIKKVQFDATYLEHINNNISLEPEIYTQRKMLFVGLKSVFYSVDSEKNNIGAKLPPLWDEFTKRMDEIECMVPDVGYGVIRQTPKMTDELEYYAVAEVNDIGHLPDGMVHVELPEATYAKFTHRGLPENVNETVSYIYSSWLLRSGMRHTYAPDLEIYGREYIPNSDESVISYAIPVQSQEEL